MLDNQQRQRHDVPDGQPYDDATNVRATALLGITSITGEACRLPNKSSTGHSEPSRLRPSERTL
jgi:hypothetical protein